MAASNVKASQWEPSAGRWHNGSHHTTHTHTNSWPHAPISTFVGVRGHLVKKLIKGRDRNRERKGAMGGRMTTATEPAINVGKILAIYQQY